MTMLSGRAAAVLLAGQAVAYTAGWAIGHAIDWTYRKVRR